MAPVLLIVFMVAAPLATVDTPASIAQVAPRPDKPVFLTLHDERLSPPIEQSVLLCCLLAWVAGLYRPHRASHEARTCSPAWTRPAPHS